jgi:hypothetical protein
VYGLVFHVHFSCLNVSGMLRILCRHDRSAYTGVAELGWPIPS